ncbi:MAG: ABC transporter ATP-binding protein, partial [Wenzhouxiangellaceae bacterium]
TIVGLRRPQAGRIRLFGIDALEADEETRLGIDRRNGVMFQDGALFSSLTVRENVEVPLRAVPDLPERLRQSLADLKISMSGLPYKAG